MRIAFTIIQNGEHHLEHNNQYGRIARAFDYWILVEGVSLPNGSTSWCKELPKSMHRDFISNDGTTEMLDMISATYTNMRVIRNNGKPWNSKDEQVNAAITQAKIEAKGEDCFLWQIDIDEQWTVTQTEEAEQMLVKNGGKTGCFLCDYYVGPNQQVFGAWGEGRYEPYRRLWNWKGEKFLTHEPPTLEGKNGPGLLLPQRFKHYAYYFEQDVKFKEAYYQGYEGLHARWLEVQKNRDRLHIKQLLGPNTWWGQTDTTIQYSK